MYMYKFICASLLIISFFDLNAQDLNVTKYDLIIQISDTSNQIQVVETINFSSSSASNQVNFNLVSKNAKGEGMTVSSVKINGKNQKYSHENDVLSFENDPSAKVDGLSKVTINFAGIPQDGLIIGKNRYGNRTFFGDNWPNRAQHWFACNDHPLDKAKVDFSIIAPQHYEVIANGKFLGDVNYASGLKMHSFSSEYELPTKVIVFGAADFSVETLTDFTRFELTSWVYPENEKAGFSDMLAAIEVLDYFESKISPYPFEKLANVQSTTRYGGMENAGCIFYSERAITGKGMMEELIAHEIAHQWFGNSATESDWSHLWLSEGFATYLTHLYVLEKYGADKLEDGLSKDRQVVKHFYAQQVLPLVDTISTNPNEMLNANAYQRGAWVLHMLHNELGDELFWKGIQNYYQNYQYKNATSRDFIVSVEQATGKDLSLFAKQWLYSGVIPDLKFKSKIKGKKLSLSIIQEQSGTAFHFPIDIEITLHDGSKEIKTVMVESAITELNMKTGEKIKSISVDPNVKLLYMQ